MSQISDSTSHKGFAGLTVAAFESRMADQMANLISRHGGIPLVAPSMQEIPLENNSEALAFGEQLLSGQIDMLILLTGVGTRTLVDVLNTRWSMEDITHALTQTTLVVRGPKPMAALKELGLTPQLTVPEPNTWEDILHSLDTFKPEKLSGLSIGIQEYGMTNEELMEALSARGAQAIGVPVYRWALPNDVAPLQQVLQAILSQTVDVVLFTSGAQATHIVELLVRNHDLEAFKKALNNLMVGSIGSITSQRLRELEFPVDFEPSHSKMGVLVKEAGQEAHKVLHRKRPPLS